MFCPQADFMRVLEWYFRDDFQSIEQFCSEGSPVLGRPNMQKLLGVVHYTDYFKGCFLHTRGPVVKEFLRYLDPALKNWQSGNKFNNKIICLFDEVGVGDSIMALGCLHEVLKRATLVIFVTADYRRIPLIERSFPDIVVMGADDFRSRFKRKVLETAQKRRRDFLWLYKMCIAMSDTRFLSSMCLYQLPYLLYPMPPASPVNPEPWILPDISKLEKWKHRFDAIGNGVKVGISWRGGGDQINMQLRSTVLSQWSPIFSVLGVHFINLQYGDCASELKEAKDTMGITIHDWEDSDPLKDLDDFAAKVKACDFIISIDGSTIHFAGSMGVPTWVLLPSKCNLRWMRIFEDTPLYDSVRFFRQLGDNWDPVFLQVAESLLDYIRTGHFNPIKPEDSYVNFIMEISKKHNGKKDEKR